MHLFPGQIPDEGRRGDGGEQTVDLLLLKLEFLDSPMPYREFFEYLPERRD